MDNGAVMIKPLIKIHHFKRSQTDPCLLCIPGLGAHGLYFQWLAKKLVPKRIQLVSFDFRGHGQSQGRRGDIDSFERYLEDIHQVVTWIRKKVSKRPLYVLGESLGASFAVQYARRYPQYFDSVILAAPVFQSKVSYRFFEVGKFLFWMIFNSAHPVMNLRGRETVGCRLKRFIDFTKRDELFVEKVSVRYLWKTWGWLKHSLAELGKISLPLLVFEPAVDRVTHYQKTYAQFKKLSQSKKWVKVANAYHCVLQDPRTPVVEKEILRWLKNNKT